MWTTQYEANELPDAATPAWTKSPSFDATTEEISPAGYLHLVSNTDGDTAYKKTDSNLSNAIGTTVEAKIQAISVPTRAAGLDAIGVYIYDGTRSVVMYIYSDAVELYDGGSIAYYEMDTTDDYHTYHMTLKGTAAKVYVDGVLRVSGETPATTAVKQIMFAGGDWWGAAVESSWDYLYYRTDGAFPPGRILAGSRALASSRTLATNREVIGSSRSKI